MNSQWNDLTVNGFPSENDYQTYQDLASPAEEFGAKALEWRNSFSAYIGGPYGTLREYEEFNQADSHDFSTTPIPRPGQPGYNELLNSFDQAEADTNKSCGGN